MSKKYKVFRKDRVDSVLTETRGGGVLIAVKNEIDCEDCATPEMDGLEAVSVKIPLNKGFLFIYCLYIQPLNNFEMYRAHTEAIKSVRIDTNDILIFAGDFNLPDVKWVESDDSFELIPLIGDSMSIKANIARHVTESMSELGLSQMNMEPNISGNVLDLIYSNVPELTVSEIALNRLIPFEESDRAHNHLSITIECNPNVILSNEKLQASYCFRKANFDLIREYLDSCNFDDFLIDNDIDQMVERFYALLYETFERFVPKASIKATKNPVWFNKKLCNLKNLCNRQYKKLCAAKKSDGNAFVEIHKSMQRIRKT